MGCAGCSSADTRYYETPGGSLWLCDECAAVVADLTSGGDA